MTDEGKGLLMGWLLGALMVESGNPDTFWTELSAKPLMDEQGNYLPAIDITVASGTYRLMITEAHDITEEP